MPQDQGQPAVPAVERGAGAAGVLAGVAPSDDGEEVRGAGRGPARAAVLPAVGADAPRPGTTPHRDRAERLRHLGRIVDLPHYYSDEDPDGDFHLPDPVTDDAVGEAFRTWEDECDRSRPIVAEAGSLDLPNAGGVPLRWLVVYVLREAIDGATGE